jgi:hypothetical protein
MRASSIAGVSRHRSFHTTRRDPAARLAPDLVNRKFTADGPNQLWVADMTYIPTQAGVLSVSETARCTMLSSTAAIPSWPLAPVCFLDENLGLGCDRYLPDESVGATLEGYPPASVVFTHPIDSH